MNVYVDLNPAAFLGRVRPMLEAREAENNLILGASIRLCEHPDWTETPAYLAAVVDDNDRPVLAAVIIPPHNILLAAEPTAPADQLDRALALLAQNLLESSRPVPGVMAEKNLSERFARVWTQATGKPSRVKSQDRTFELRRVIPPPNPPPGWLRLATPQDEELVARWRLAFTQEALGEGSLEESQTWAARQIGLENAFLWDDGGPVSMAIRARPTPHGYTVTGVYTPPELRGRGYASACVAALSQRLLDGGKQFCTLFTDLSNPISNSIYQKIGYRPLCDFENRVFEA